MSRCGTFLLGWLLLGGQYVIAQPATAGKTPVKTQPAPTTNSPAAVNPALAAWEDALSTIIARAEPSIVAVARLDPVAPGRVVPDPRRDPQSDDFLADEFAAGVVLDARGLILTAAHVVRPDAKHWVTVYGGKRYPARIKGADPRSDLAVLEIEATDLRPITIGDAARLKKGQLAVVLGNPYAIARDGSPSAAVGIIANLGRKLPGFAGRDKLYHYATLIQTDAALNLGTSGGALLNSRGEMIGLTTSLAATAGYEQAAGYALPTNETFRRAVELLKQGREVEYGFLGVKPENLADHERGDAGGVRVLEVVPGTPAQRSGLQAGDIVTQIDNHPISTVDALVLLVGGYAIDATVNVTFIRDRRPLETRVELTKFPVPGVKIITAPGLMWRGMTLDYATTRPEDLERASRMTAVRDGAVVITAITADSPATVIGLEPGTFVLSVNDVRVSHPREFRTATAKVIGAVKLQIVRPGSSASETVELTAER